MNRARPEMNTTPLIDVLLVLLVLLILTLPRATHTVGLDMPRARAAFLSPPPTIRVDIEFDGRVFWNGVAIAAEESLWQSFENVADDPAQPRIQITPDRHAPYERVVQVLAAAQRAHLTRIGLTPVPD